MTTRNPPRRTAAPAVRLRARCRWEDDRWVVADAVEDGAPLFGRLLTPGEDLLAACAALMAAEDRLFLDDLAGSVREAAAATGDLRLVIGGEARIVRVNAVAAPGERPEVAVVLADVTHDTDAGSTAGARIPDLARAMERAGAGIYDLRFADGAIEVLYASPALGPLLGRDFDQADARDVYFECIHPDDRPFALRRAEALRDGRPQPPWIHRIVRPDGTVRWVRNIDHSSVGLGGVVRITGVFEDVTDRHDLDEGRLLAAQAFGVRVVVAHVRDDGSITVANERGRAEWTALGGEEDGSPVAALVRQAAAGLEPVERVCPCPGGLRTVVARTIGHERDGWRVAVAAGTPGGPAWSGWRQVMDAVQQSIAVIVCQPDGRRRVDYVNGTVRRALPGELPENAFALTDALVSAIHPADRPAVQGALEALLRGDGDGRVSFRFIEPDGRVRWMSQRHVIVGADAEGITVATVGDDAARQRDQEAHVRRLLSATGGLVYEHQRRNDGGAALEMDEIQAALMLQSVVPTDPREAARAWADAVHDDDRLRYQQWDASGSEEPLEYRLVRPGGPPVWVRDMRIAVRDNTSLGLVADITREKVASMHSSLAIDGLPAVMFDAQLVTSDNRWRIFGVGGQSPRSISRSFPDDPVEAARMMLDAVHPDDRQMVSARLREAAVSGRTAQLVYRARRANGAVRWMRLVLVRREIDRDHVTLSVSATDVTDLRYAEQRILRMIDSFQEAFFEYTVPPDGDLSLDYNNTALERILGRSLPEDPHERAQAALSCVHPEDRSEVVARLRAGADGDRPVVLEHRVVRPDGEVRWVAAEMAPSHDTGLPHRFAGVLRDVTEQRRTEQRFQRILDAVDDVVFELEVGEDDPHTTYVSPSATRILGVPPEHAGPCPPIPAGMLGRGDVDRMRAAVRAVSERGGTASEVVRMQAPDGEVRVLRMMLARTGRAGARVLVGGILRDVTDLRQDREDVRAALETVSDVVREVELGPNGTWRLLYLSEGAAALTGRPLPREPEARLRSYTQSIHPDDAPGLDAQCRALVTHGDVMSAVYRLVRPDGDVRWVRSTLTPLLDGAGHRVGVAEIATDATDTLSPAQPSGGGTVERVVAGVGDILYEIRLGERGSSTTTYLSPPFWDFAGITPYDDVDPLDQWHAAVHPDDVAIARGHCEAVANGERTVTTYRIIRPVDGREMTVRLTGTPRVAEDGSRFVAGTIADVGGLSARPSAPAPSVEDVAPPPGCPLTDRQLAVLALVAQGCGTDEVAQRLGIRAVTVNNHVAGALRRLGARSRLEAVAKARKAGWIA